MSATARLAAWG